MLPRLYAAIPSRIRRDGTVSRWYVVVPDGTRLGCALLVDDA
jgi:hypothetical protein